MYANPPKGAKNGDMETIVSSLSFIKAKLVLDRSAVIYLMLLKGLGAPQKRLRTENILTNILGIVKAQLVNQVHVFL